nr:MAG TPA: adenine specific DNA methyltransferase [Caudoviricetes sp.]
MPTVQNLKIADLKPYPNNPRVNDEAVAGVVASIREYGFIGAIVVNRDLVIINGHTRVKAMKEIGAESIPAIVVDHLTPEQEKALRIADNKTGEVAKWDMDLLKAEMKALQEAGFDMGALGFDTSELDELLGGTADEMGQTDPDDAPEAPEVAVSKPGEVYVLGQHLLLCGDSTRREDVAKVAGDGTVDCWLTDPPYNVAYEGSNGLTIQNDSMEDSKFREFLRNAFVCAEKAMKPGAAFYVFHADSEGYNFRGACFDVGLRVRECLVWKKNALVLGRQDYQWIHEPCLYGWKEGASHTWYGDRAQTTVMEFNKPKKNDVHPTMKPTEMLVYLLKNSTKRGDVVLDTFGGSGSTIIACQQTGRVCRCVELDPKYCDVIRRRWAEHVHGEGCDWQTLTPCRECANAADQVDDTVADT